MESTGYWNDFISNAKTFFPFPLRFYDENIFEYAAFCLFLYASISRFNLAISDLMPKTDRITFLPPATKLGQGYVFTRVCDSVHREGIPACLAAGLQGVCYPSMHCRWYSSMPCSRSPGGGAAPGGCLVRHPPRDGYCCRRYASYWNAFLLYF